MELKQASQIQFADYTIHPEFRKLCDFAESLDIGISDEFLYRARDGTKQGLDILIRQAAWADKKRKGIEETVSLPFVLSYLDEGFIPFQVFDNAAIELAKKYQSKFGVAIDETTAMAAVLLGTNKRNYVYFTLWQKAITIRWPGAEISLRPGEGWHPCIFIRSIMSTFWKWLSVA